jgi:beta-lactamase superfamily II metal-dependent hydrolase
MSDTVLVRMYNVGFGDCFLLVLPDKRTILVDAGFHSQGKGAFGGNELVEQIIADLTEIKGEARIDVVIATHRHQDHVYAFNSKNWDKVEVGEVWLPWVEDRANEQATRLWKKQQGFARGMAAAVPLLGLDDDKLESVKFMLWNAGVGESFGFDAGGWSNAGALDCLHEGFARRDRVRPRFLPETETFPESFESPVLPGVRVYVLGPPRDPELIEEIDPENDGETYRALALLAAAGPAFDGAMGRAAPFGEIWQVPDHEEPAFVPIYEEDKEHIRELIQNADAVFAATKVDGMINSTSLVLVLEIGKARLLLPGDAEWGTWKRILANDEARTLLRGATFFKVGHHGSHNATSKSLVEKFLPRGIPAMISTQKGAGTYRNNIPLGDLLTALEDHEINYVRSDLKDIDLPDGFEQEVAAKWIDLELPC